jgi:hypothetical protein
LERPLLVVSGLLKTDRKHLRTPNRRFARAKPEVLFPALCLITTALRCQPLIAHSVAAMLSQASPPALKATGSAPEVSRQCRTFLWKLAPFFG